MVQDIECFDSAVELICISGEDKFVLIADGGGLLMVLNEGLSIIKSIDLKLSIVNACFLQNSLIIAFKN